MHLECDVSGAALDPGSCHEQRDTHCPDQPRDRWRIRYLELGGASGRTTISDRPVCIGYTDSHQYRYADTNGNANEHRHSNCYLNHYTNGDAHADAHRHKRANEHSHSHRAGCADIDSYANIYSHRDQSAQPDHHNNRDGDRDADSDEH
jgi:hypothetical protein